MHFEPRPLSKVKERYHTKDDLERYYWTQKRDLTEEEWLRVVAEILAIEKECQGHGIHLTLEVGQVDDEGGFNTLPTHGPFIVFNGQEPDDHESAFFTRVKPTHRYRRRDPVMQWCKTAFKPYDYAVVQFLGALMTVAGDAYQISSDGDVPLMDGKREPHIQPRTLTGS